MTEQSIDEADEPKVDISMGLTMHPEDKVIMKASAFGLRPTIVIELEPSPIEDAPLHVEVNVYGIGTSKDDVLAMGNLFTVLGMSIEDKGEAAYVVSTQEEEDDSADDHDGVERPAPDAG